MSSSPANALRWLPRHAYTVGWISALPVDHSAACEILDEKHHYPDFHDDETACAYTLGRILGHNVVIACLPSGRTGLVSAASTAARLAERFPNAKIGLMVGVGGGVPSSTDIRLGDVVVSVPNTGNGGVVQYDMGKRTPNGVFEQTGHLNKPPNFLLNAVTQVRSNHIRRRSTFESHLSKLELNPEFARPNAGLDRLFQAEYQHTRGPSCDECSELRLVSRDPRPAYKLVEIHYGTIASANSLMRDGVERDSVCRDLGGHILCFEMEAAGLMDDFPCLVVRGISNYADSHKNKTWESYAAATAAAYAKEILSVIPPTHVIDEVPLRGTIRRTITWPLKEV